MADINKVIRVGDTLTNIIDSVTKKSVNYRKVTTWYDGSPMTNEKVDGVLYRKKGSEYFRQVIDKDGELFLEKDTMAQMRALSLTERLFLKAGIYKGIQLNGYYLKGDTSAPIQYLLSTTSAVDDGGSVILSGDIKLEHKFIGEVDGKYFGIHKSNTLPKEEVIVLFKNWQNYVNTTNGCYFKLSSNVSTYYVYEPLYIRKSFIGDSGLPRLQYIATEVGKVVSPTETTVDGRFDFNVPAVMGINPLSYSDSQDRLQFKDFKIYCTSGDDDVTPAQDFGIYYPLGTSFDMDNILVVRPDNAGFRFREVWMSTLNRLNAWGCRRDGFSFIGTFTSLTVNSCYVHGFKRRGWDVNGLMYCSWTNLGADGGVDATCGYSFVSCKGTTVSGLGNEGSTLDSFMLIGDYQGSIDGIFGLDNDYKKAVIENHTDSIVDISNISLVNCRRFGSNTVNSFKITSVTTNGLNNNIRIYNSSNIDLSGYNASSIFPTLGIVAFLYKNNWTAVLNGAWVDLRSPEVVSSLPASPYMGKQVFSTSLGKLGVHNGTIWLDALGRPLSALTEGSTAQRPTTLRATGDKGFWYYDNNLNKPMYWNGTTWGDLSPNATIAVKGIVNQAAYSADTATAAAGANPTKAEFDALLAEFRDFKTKSRTSGQSATS